MGVFSVWIQHRMNLVGCELAADLASRAGVPIRLVYQMLEWESLEEIDRSECKHLADALCVSLRKMEQLEEGRRNWIEDNDRIYPDGCWAWGRDDEPRPVKAKEGRGVPELGWIFEMKGKIDIDDCWDEAFGPRLDFFLRGHKRAYAFRIGFTEDRKWKVFHDLPSYQIQAGQKISAYIGDGFGGGEGVYGTILFVGTDKIRMLVGDERREFKSDHIWRVGKMISEYPHEDGGMPIGAEKAENSNA